ncbi:MAG: ferritin [Spirochaetota bacterium]
MALSKKIHDGLNEQIAREFQAHFLYRAVAMDLYDKGYEGFAGWMEQHATEEYGHAERIIAYLKENDARVLLPAVPKPQDSWSTVQAAVEAALAHEKKLTSDIHELHRLADEEGDLATVSMLDWFVSEQVEEEHIVNRLLKRISLGGDSAIGLIVIDAELRATVGAGEAQSEAE